MRQFDWINGQLAHLNESCGQHYKTGSVYIVQKNKQRFRERRTDRGLTCPSRPIFTGLCSFHELVRCADFVKGNSRLKKCRINSIKPPWWKEREVKNNQLYISSQRYLQIQSILKTPPSILAFMPAGRTQWIGEPPWCDSDESRAKPERKWCITGKEGWIWWDFNC